jgi:RNA polymerase sigma-70 factor (ECF subfamily)
MAPSNSGDSSQTAQLLARAAAGDHESWGVLLERYRDRLRRTVDLRLHPRLQRRIDASDVIQEAFLEASTRLADYLRNPDMPFFVWLRFLACQRLVTLHRQHLGTNMRELGREVSLYRGSMPEATSAQLAAHLLGHDTRPSEAAVRAELKILLQEALNSMDPLDREVLALRHFEPLTRAESAIVLGIEASAAGKRYMRALKRLKEILSRVPGGMREFLP